MKKQPQLGDKIKYIGYDGKQHVGTIHGIQNHETPEGLIKQRNYLIDTGNNASVQELVTAEGHDNIFIRQPEQITISEGQLL